MSYGVREYGTREYGDGMRVITTAVGGGGGGDPIAGTDTLTFGGSATLLPGVTQIAGVDVLTLSGSGTLTGRAPMAADPAVERITFGGYATLTVEVPVVPPPADAPWIKKVTVTMPAPTTFRRGRPTA